MTCDVLVVAPHPDDAEIACAGAMLLLIAQGKKVAVLDMTRGEMGTRGDADTRAKERAAATKVLGLSERLSGGLPDTMVGDSEEARRALVGVIRKLQPRLLLAPIAKDPHPDHVATAQLVSSTFFLAGLTRLWPDLGPPHRPSLVLRYPLHEPVEPTICVDITKVWDKKREVVACYTSQLKGASNEHFIKKLDIWERIEIRDRAYGARIGVKVAEPYVAEGAVPLAGLSVLLG